MSLRFALPLHDPGKLIGDYQIHEVIGHGGAGAVYAAIDLRGPGQRVAIKETFDTLSIRSFEQEFAVLHRLQHPHLPAYHSMFELGGNGYLVMELVEGQSLQEVRDRHNGPLPESQVLGYALQLCDVLTYLHSQSPPIFHRDIKPANIRLTPEGRIKLVDFGLLKQGVQQTRHTMRGMGTPAYAPIEQYGQGRESTEERSDIYSLGATLYHLLTGIEPPSAPERIATKEDPLDVRALRDTNASRDVANAILGAMAPLRDERPASAEAMKQLMLGHGFVPFKLPKPKPAPVRKPKPAPPSLVETRQHWRGLPNPVRALTWGKGGQVVAVATGRDARLLYPNGETLTADEHTDEVSCLSFDATDRYLISAGWDRHLHLWDRLHRREIRAIPAHSEPITSVVFHPTEPLVASAGWDEQLQLWQLEGRTLHLVETGSGWGRIASLAWHPDGQSILIGTMAGQIQTLGRQGSSGASLTLQSGSGVACLAVSPAGDLLASGHADGTVRLWHLADQKLFQSFASHQRGVTALTWDPSGRLLLSGGWDRDIFFWEAATGRELGTVEVEGAVRSLAWRPQYNHVACAYAPQNVVLWQVRMEALK